MAIQYQNHCADPAAAWRPVQSWQIGSLPTQNKRIQGHLYNEADEKVDLLQRRGCITTKTQRDTAGASTKDTGEHGPGG